MVVVISMLERSKTWARTAIRYGSILGFVFLASCSKKSTPSGAAGGPDAGAAKDPLKAKPVPSAGQGSCRSPSKGASFTLGAPEREREPENGAGDAEGDDEELPFATTLGNAVAIDERFWVTAIDYRNRQSHAVLARIEPTVDRGTVFDLGRVFGDAEPPRIAAQGRQLIVVMPDSDASGRTLKVGRISTSDARGRVEWFDSVAEGVDDSPVFTMATNQDTIVLAWDDLDKATRRGVVRFRAAQSAKAESSQGTNAQTTAVELDAEAPRLIARTGGFWLGYLVNERVVRKPPADEKSEERPVVELGQRGIQLQALDSSGRVSGRPIAITAPGAHVVTFEMDATAAGGAVVAYRDANSAPGIEEDVVEIAELRPDGSVSRLRMEDDRVGLGAPLLLTSSVAKPDESVWIMVAGKSAEMQITSYRLGESRLAAPVSDPLLAGAEPLLRDGANLFVARTKGRSVEFERIDCHFEREASPSPAVNHPQK